MLKLTFCLFLLLLGLSKVRPEECGQAHGHVSTIYLGKTVNKGDWPWLAAIFRKTGRSIEFICAGSLVSKSHIVTAAHCLFTPNSYSIPSRDLIVYVGKHSLFAGNDKDETQLSSVSAKHLHPQYNHSSAIRGNDIAVLVLEQPVSYTNLIKPICLWKSGPDPSTGSDTGTAVGWGATNEETKDISEDPRFVHMPVVTNEECLASLDYFRTSGIVTDRTICAGKRDGSGTCSGDSGGGLYVIRDKRWILRGIVSKSILNKNTNGCNLYQYAVMTDVYKYIPWLYRAIGIDTKDTVTEKPTERPTLSTSTIQPIDNVYEQVLQPTLPTVEIGYRSYYIGKDASGKGLSWSDAEKYCIQNNMKLAAFETRQENDAMVDYLKSKKYPNSRITLWIGGTNTDSYSDHGNWKWSILNSEITYKAWGRGQGTNPGEDCLGINPHEGYNGWHDIPCNVAFSFICEKTI